MSSFGSQSFGMMRTPPAYFTRVLLGAQSLWDKLEADPVLAGPWRQLFSQVQSPRHVVSELLQNADDAGASMAKVRINNGSLVFEHDGADFTADQFESLCRFGFSNKRNLHTIGFRGIGFKSTFSLGNSVEVHTPTLAVRFNESRFTQPNWIVDSAAVTQTTVRVRIQDEHREKELRKNLLEWMGSPASLLFFSNIRSLEIDGVVIECKELGHGPVPNSKWIGLTGTKSHRILVARSEEEAFPADLMEELRHERHSKDVTLPPCRVEIVLGLSTEQRLFVVLPTGVKPNLPFSCNAPFVQDPARMAIKDPSVSPTNRWLLSRLGRLAATVMQGWLANKTLSLTDRALAYDMLPALPTSGDSVSANSTSAVARSFADTMAHKAVLLTAAGDVTLPLACFAPPVALYDVWEPDVLLKVFAKKDEPLLARTINEFQRSRLAHWNWLSPTNPAQIVEVLERENGPPRPESDAAVFALWSFVVQTVHSDHGGQRRRKLAIVPVAGQSRLFPANRVVRLASSRRNVKTEDWDFLAGNLRVADDDWLQNLNLKQDPGAAQGNAYQLDSCRSLLKDLGLIEPTPIASIAEYAAQAFFGNRSPRLEDCVRLTHIFAALDVEAPLAMRFVTRDEVIRPAADGIVLDDGGLEMLVPEAWASRHVLHSDYFKTGESCSRAQWQQWISGGRARFRSCPWVRAIPSSPKQGRTVSREIRVRGVKLPARISDSKFKYIVEDFDFDEEVWDYWTKVGEVDTNIWAKAMARVLRAPVNEWANRVYATIQEDCTTNTRILKADLIPAMWVHRLRSVSCLFDQYGMAHAPAALLIRTPDTEPLLSIEPFVGSDLDREETKPLLRLLGARDTPAGAGSVLGRIKDLAAGSSPPIRELAKWYDTLDRVLARRRPEDLAAIKLAFASERLIFTSDAEWVCAPEVFQRLTDDDPPGLPVLHDDFATLAMWTLIGVADRPSADLLIAHLCSLESGKKLDGTELRCVRSILPHWPNRVWQDCGHWLSLDGSWVPTTDFDMVMFDDSSIRVRELFPGVKRRTADCRELGEEDRKLRIFGKLRDLGQSIEFRLNRKQTDLAPVVDRPWMRVLGEALGRITCADQQEQSNMNDVGRRLSTLRWQPFFSLSVTPYLDGTPAGQDDEPEVLLKDDVLYAREAPMATILDAVVAELGRHFPGEAMQKAIRSCFERDAAFVNEYLAIQFKQGDETSPAAITDSFPTSTAVPELSQNAKSPASRSEPDSVVESPNESTQPTQPSRVLEVPVVPDKPLLSSERQELVSSAERTQDALVVDSPQPIDALPTPAPTVESQAESVPESPEPTRQTRERKQRELDQAPTLIARFAQQSGFRWEGSAEAYGHPDGTRIAKSEGLFSWEHRRGERTLCRYWLSEQCLMKAGVEVGADVWELLRKSPETTAIVVIGEEDRPLCLRGSELARMVNDKAVEVVAAKYRLRRIAGAE